MLTHLTHWHDNAEILRLATSANGELLAMSGPRNPYQAKLGVIEADALADLLVVDGNPINDIDLVATPDKNFMIIVKDGQIYKDPRRSALGRADWCLSSTRSILQPPAKC